MSDMPRKMMAFRYAEDVYHRITGHIEHFGSYYIENCKSVGCQPINTCRYVCGFSEDDPKHDSHSRGFEHFYSSSNSTEVTPRNWSDSKCDFSIGDFCATHRMDGSVCKPFFIPKEIPPISVAKDFSSNPADYVHNCVLTPNPPEQSSSRNLEQLFEDYLKDRFNLKTSEVIHACTAWRELSSEQRENVRKRRPFSYNRLNEYKKTQPWWKMW